MNVRAVWSVVLVGVLAVTTAGPGSGHAAGGALSAPDSPSVTVRGVLERVSLEGNAAEPIRYVVRGSERTWWLARLPMPILGLGAVLLVEGETGSYGLAGAVAGTLALMSSRPPW